MSLLKFTSKGIFCPQAQLYIDPWKPVHRALITHGHSDHARWGHRYYACTQSAAPVIRYRLGDINITEFEYGETFSVNGVKISFHPAGHIIGSAQIRLEYKGEIWVCSGDYKRENDGISEAFELVQCQHFITECTFGLPVYKWPKQSVVFDQINDWWKQNKEQGVTSIIGAYSLGKAQRIIHNVDHGIGKIYTHGAIENTNKVIRDSGIDLHKTKKVSQNVHEKEYPGSLVLAAPSGVNSNWIKKFKKYSLASASGWMMLRGTKRRRAVDRGFILSDHVDWPDLCQTVKETGAEHIYPTHGYTDIFAKWCQEQGYQATPVQTEFVGESPDAIDDENMADEKL